MMQFADQARAKGFGHLQRRVPDSLPPFGGKIAAFAAVTCGGPNGTVISTGPEELRLVDLSTLRATTS